MRNEWSIGSSPLRESVYSKDREKPGATHSCRRMAYKSDLFIFAILFVNVPPSRYALAASENDTVRKGAIVGKEQTRPLAIHTRRGALYRRISGSIQLTSTWET